MNNKNFLTTAGPLLLVLLIDGMGLGLVFPILNGLVFDSHFLPASLNTPTMQNIIYGATVGIFMLCWFFGAAILGELSDQIGRKKSLLICLLGAFFSYLLSAIAVISHSIVLLLIGRVIAGFTSGSQPIAQAAIIDLSTPENKVRNLGLILFAISLGFIIGPLLGGVLSDPNIISWFNFSIPFIFAALVSFINIGLLLLFFNETFVTRATTLKINPTQAINIFISAFKHEQIRKLSVIFFIFMIGWSSFYSFAPMYLLKVFAFTPTQVSLYMALMGVGFGIGNGYLSNFFARLFSLRSNFIVSCMVMAVLTAFGLIVNSELLTWILIAPIATAASIAYTSILTMFSDQVDENSQGWVMGVNGSIMAFVFGVDGIIVGAIAAWHDLLPLVIAAIALLVTSVIAVFS